MTTYSLQTMRAVAWAAILLAAAPLALAETVYVTERLVVPLHATFAEDSPVVKSVEVGTRLDVIERVDAFTHVRDASGADGWIETRFLVAAPPARAQVERLQADLAKARKDLADAQARVAELEAAAQTAAAPADAAEPPPAPAVPTSDTDDEFPWGWAVLAFAMLWLGFGAGVVWLRERNRKKLGGMYLRI